jgi:transposase
MYRNMNDWAEIRRRVLVDGVSRRQILRETGMHRLTLKKILEHSEPPGYRQQQPRPQKKLGAFIEQIKQILKEDQALPRKQRHTAKRIWERLQEDGFTGGYTVVKDAVRELVASRTDYVRPHPCPLTAADTTKASSRTMAWSSFDRSGGK